MLESRSAYGWYRDCGVTGEDKPAGEGCIVRRMPYWEYKKKYSDCKTVEGSYNKRDKTIEIYIPNERIKPSGMRDKKISWFIFWFEIDGEVFSTHYKSVNESNAKRRFESDCKKYHWKKAERAVNCREFDRYSVCQQQELVEKVFRFAPELNPWK